MSIVRFHSDPFGDVLSLQQSIERAFHQPFFGSDWTPSGRGVYPALNFFERDDALVVKAEIAGLDREKLDVEIEGHRLMLSGARAVPPDPKEGRYHRRERRFGEFRRVFRLPYEVDREKATASYADGVLTVRLEKAEAAKPRQITVGG